MSHVRVKTEYYVEGAYGSTEKKTLYAHHNLSCDSITFFDEDGNFMFCVDDTVKNNLFDAIQRLYSPRDGANLEPDVQYMNREEIDKCGF